MESVRSVKNRWIKETTSVFLLLTVLIFGLFLSSETVNYVKEGMNLAISCVIPSSFPFMVISDMYVAYGKPENILVLRKSLCKLLSFSPKGLAPLICGNIGGFPIGAKMVSDLYSSGSLSRNEAERLLPLCNNPSCAFIIGGVGLGIYGDARLGFLLLSAVYTSTLICGMITRSNCTENVFTKDNMKQNYIFVESVKRAGINSVSIISFISIFSVLTGIVKNLAFYYSTTSYSFNIYPLFFFTSLGYYIVTKFQLFLFHFSPLFSCCESAGYRPRGFCIYMGHPRKLTFRAMVGSCLPIMHCENPAIHKVFRNFRSFTWKPISRP